MNLTNFKDHISPVIFERGEDYYLDGAVTDLQDMENGQWFAIVEGNEDYEVDIRTGSMGKIMEYNCNCPYDGEICKHVVAVLLAINDEVDNTETGKRETKTKSGWKEIISVSPEKELREFVKKYAAKHKDFRNELTISLSNYDSTENRQKYRQIIRDIFSLSSDRNGYIDYYSSRVAFRPAYDLLERAGEYIKGHNYWEAFHIAVAIAPECVQVIQYMDDSDGECGGAISGSFHIISEILKSSPDEPLRNEIFEWLLEQANNPDYDDYGCADELEPLLIEAADTPAKINMAHKFIDQQIAKAAQQEGWSKQYNSCKYLRFKMILFENAGEYEKAETIIHDNIRISDFREIIVGRKLEEKDYNEAIRIIKEGIQIAIEDNYAGTATRWKEKLLEIYQQQKDVKNIRKYALELYFYDRFNMGFYKIFKRTWDNKEWPAERDKIIARVLKGYTKQPSYGYLFPSPVATIFVEEKMWDKLFGLVKQTPRIDILLGYASYLKELYAPDMIEMFKPAIEDYAERNMGRKAYQQAVFYLKEMSKIEGGKKAARILATQLLEKHNNRPAMKEEFGKLLLQPERL